MKGANANNAASKKLTDKKRKSDPVSNGNKLAKKDKAGGKDSNKPKRPAGPFFIFMEEFRKTFKEQNPSNNSIAAVSKAGGVKWKSMSESDKAPFIAGAEKRKAEYEKLLTAHNNKPDDAAAEENDESDKSKSEVNDEDGESVEGENGN